LGIARGEAPTSTPRGVVTEPFARIFFRIPLGDVLRAARVEPRRLTDSPQSWGMGSLEMAVKARLPGTGSPGANHAFGDGQMITPPTYKAADAQLAFYPASKPSGLSIPVLSS
jgi:hypothetical protein